MHCQAPMKSGWHPNMYMAFIRVPRLNKPALSVAEGFGRAQVMAPAQVKCNKAIDYCLTYNTFVCKRRKVGL